MAINPTKNIPVEPPFTVLPLPPNEYDVVYMMTLIRSLTYILQQLANPGNIIGSSLTIFANRPYSGYVLDKNPDLTFNALDSNTTNSLIVRLLPQGNAVQPAGLASNQIWWDTSNNTLKIVP
jgi:hypothetical protein